MKTRNMNVRLRLGFVALFLMMFSVASYSQYCAGNNVTISMANPVVNTNNIEFDVYVKNTSANNNTMKLTAYAGGITLLVLQEQLPA